MSYPKSRDKYLIPGLGIPSQNNSTTTTLTGGATYTGTADLNGHPDVMCSCYADVAGTLYFDFSGNDGDDWRTFPTNGFVVSAGVHEFHTAVKGPRSFRVRFVNGASAQGTFQLFTYFGAFRQPNAPLNQSISADSDAVLTRTVDTMLDISAGRFSGFTPVARKFGRAPNGAQATITDVWDRADATPTQQIWVAPTAARVHALVSSSTDDDGSPAGVGAHSVQVFGLQDWGSEESSETVTLNGTTPVNTSNSYVIIHRMRASSWGASGPNVGTITATAATDSTVTAQIGPGIGSTRMAIYGLPSTQDFYIRRWTASIEKASGAAADCDFRLVENVIPDTNPRIQGDGRSGIGV